MAHCTFYFIVAAAMFLYGPPPTAHTKIHASVVYSDIPELNSPFWEKIYGALYNGLSTI